jgi:EAL domain-containing protein (putative c-di-GMP-specific phosphodiesterase class I)/AmiR/NasT family two-component response regulator
MSPTAKPHESALFETARVLIVDDVSTNVVLLERILASAQVSTVLGLTDPRQVVDACRSFEPDLVLLDLHMPDLDGIQVLQMMSERLTPDNFVPTIVLTADWTADARERALSAGAKDFITKPFDRIEVLLRVRNLLETRSLYSRLQRQKAAIQAELDAKIAEEEARDRELRERQRRIGAVLAARSLAVVFQPIYDVSADTIVGFEALARFESDPPRSPNEWFDEAHTVGLGIDLELLAIDRALDNFASVNSRTFLSVNVSASTAITDALHDRLIQARCPIVVELTEHLQIDNYDTIAHGLSRLRRHGIRIAVDDTGAGYAGLQQILRLHPDIIKLDLDLTRGIATDRARQALATAMVGLSRDLKATLIAEGVETQAELDTLRWLGVKCVQGYFIGPPAALPSGTPVSTYV